MGSVTRYNDGRGYDMGKIAAALSTIFSFLVAASLPAFAQSAPRDSGGYNNYYHFGVVAMRAVIETALS